MLARYTFRHNCYKFGLDSTQVGSFKTAHQLGLICFLQSANDCTLETQICFEVLSSFSHPMLEGKLANQFGGFLIASDVTECQSTRPVTMRFPHASSRGRTLVGGFCSQLFSECFLPPMDLQAVWLVQAMLWAPPYAPASLYAGALLVRGAIGIGGVGSFEHPFSFLFSHPHLRWIFPPQLTQSRTSLTNAPRDLSPG